MGLLSRLGMGPMTAREWQLQQEQAAPQSPTPPTAGLGPITNYEMQMLQPARPLAGLGPASNYEMQQMQRPMAPSVPGGLGPLSSIDMRAFSRLGGRY